MVRNRFNVPCSLLQTRAQRYKHAPSVLQPPVLAYNLHPSTVLLTLVGIPVHKLHNQLVVKPEALLLHLSLLLHEALLVGQGNLHLLVSVDLGYELFPVSAADRAVGHDLDL